MNYGFGVFRWEACKILGYSFRSKVKNGKASSYSKPKKEFLINYKNEQHFVKPYELRIDPAFENQISNLD